MDGVAFSLGLAAAGACGGGAGLAGAGFGAALGAGGGGALAAGDWVTGLAGATAPPGRAGGFGVGFGGAAALRVVEDGAGRFAAGFFAVAAFEGFGGAAFRTGAEAFRFTTGALADAFFTGFRDSGRDAGFFAALRTALPPVRFEAAAGALRWAGLAARAVVGFFGAAFLALAAEAALPEAGRGAGFFLVALFRSDEAAGRPLPGAAFLGAGRGARRAGFVLVRDLAMVRAR